MKLNPFKNDAQDYIRDINVLTNYVSQASNYISKMRNVTPEEASEWLLSEMHNEGKLKFLDPEVKMLERELDKDRVKGVTTLNQYIGEVEKRGAVITPTMTCYVPYKVRPSVIGSYVMNNLGLRKIDKKEMFRYKQLGDKVKELYYNTLQTSRKRLNNTISGAHVIYSTVIGLKSAHSSLTSTCRISTSYANICNEQLIAGNRHYWCYETIISAILMVCKPGRVEAISATIDAYNMHVPTTDELYSMITYSSDLYFSLNGHQKSQITQLLESLTPEERCDFMYTGDLYHTAMYNDELVRALFSSFIETNTDKIEDPADYINNLDSDTFALMAVIGAEYTAGKVINDIAKDAPDDYANLANIGKQIRHTVEVFELFISTFLKIPALPNSVFRVNTMLRRAVVTSDTDSTIFTAQGWVKWYIGKVDWSPTSYKIGNVMTYIAAQTVSHVMNLVSTYLGVDRDYINNLSMKNEYYMPVFAISSSAKNYFNLIYAREGNVYEKMKLDTKGAQLRGSNTPKHVQNALDDHMVYIMNMVMEYGTLTFKEFILPIIEIENQVIEGIKRGDPAYLRSQMTKDYDSYKVGVNNATYQSHVMWNKAFAAKYDPPPELPYRSVAIATKLTNPKSLLKWLNDNVDNQPFHSGMSEWMTETNKSRMPVMRFPMENILRHGFPQSVIDVIDINSLVISIMGPFYLLLESFGLFVKNKNNTRLISDEYPLEALNALPSVNRVPSIDKVTKSEVTEVINNTVNVVNVLKEECTHYCGRPTSYRPKHGVNLSVLGNPYVMKHESERDDVVERYAHHLERSLHPDDNSDMSLEIKDAIGQIIQYALHEGDVKLGCFCHPKACHCDVIAETVNNMLCE